MIAVIVTSVLFALAYTWLMVLYSKGWKKQPLFRLPEQYTPTTFITVIVPARNEEQHIGACIDSILAQKYPAELFEVIVIDDHSADNTKAIVEAYGNPQVRCLSLADHLNGKELNSYKKAALALGVQEARGSLIVTTDADCTAPNAWLMNIDCLYEQQRPDMIVAPVIYHATGGLLPVFQLIDFMSMQGITAAAHSMNMGRMSNGANFTFTKEVFERVNGYEGIDHLASGDDFLLMNKVANAGGKIAYLLTRQAIITTLPQPDWRSFFRQRIRWASKSGKYSDKKLTQILMLVYLYNLWFVVLAIMGIYNDIYWWIGGSMLALKAVTEYLYMRPITRFFDRQWTHVYFPFLQPLHVLYIVSAGFMGFIGKYQWKDRQVK